MKAFLKSLLRIGLALAVIFTAVGIWLSRSMGHDHESSYRHAMKADLRILAMLQQRHRDSAGAYGSELAALHPTPNAGVTIFDFAADSSGWQASTRHSRLPGRSCVMWEGVAPAAQPVTELERRTSIAGEPVCDGDRRKPPG